MSGISGVSLTSTGKFDFRLLSSILLATIR